MVCATQAVTKTLVSPTLTLTAPPASWAMEPVENVRFRPGTVMLCFWFMVFFDFGFSDGGAAGPRTDVSAGFQPAWFSWDGGRQGCLRYGGRGTMAARGLGLGVGFWETAS